MTGKRRDGKERDAVRIDSARRRVKLVTYKFANGTDPTWCLKYHRLKIIRAREGFGAKFFDRVGDDY